MADSEEALALHSPEEAVSDLVTSLLPHRRRDFWTLPSCQGPPQKPLTVSPRTQMSPEKVGGMGRGEACPDCLRTSQDRACYRESCCPGPTCREDKSQPPFVDLTGGSEVRGENIPLENWFPLVPVILERGPERRYSHAVSQELQELCGMAHLLWHMET